MKQFLGSYATAVLAGSARVDVAHDDSGSIHRVATSPQACSDQPRADPPVAVVEVIDPCRRDDAAHQPVQLPPGQAASGRKPG